MRKISREPTFIELPREDNSATFTDSLTIFNKIYMMYFCYGKKALKCFIEISLSLSEELGIWWWEQGLPFIELHAIYKLDFVEPVCAL